jgi:hypothetical protein
MIDILFIITNILLLILSGISLSFAFFKPKSIDIIERTTIVIALSITVVPVLIFYTNILGFPINNQTVWFHLIFVIIVGIIIFLLRNKVNLIKRKKN